MSSISITPCKNYGVVKWLPKDSNDTNYKPTFNTISLRGFFDNEKKNVEIAPSQLVIDSIYKAYFWVDDEKPAPATKSKYRVKLLLIGKNIKIRNRMILIFKFKRYSIYKRL